MNIKIAAAVVSLGMAIFLCSCSEKDSGNSKADSSSVPDTTTTTAATTTTEPETEPEPVNTFDLDGFEMDVAKSLGDNNSLSLAAMIDCDALSYGSDKINSIDIKKITDDRILLMLGYAQETENSSKKLVSLDKTTYEVKAELDYKSNTNSIPIFEDGFVLTNSSENHHEYTIYDFDMNIVGTFESTSYNEYQFTDRNTAYYWSLSDLFRYDVKSGKSEKISDSSEYYVSQFTKASRIEGNDIIIMNTVEEDHEQHTAVLNANTGDVMYFDSNGYLDILNGMLCFDKYAENYSTEYTLYATNKSNAVKLTFDTENYYHSEHSDGDRIILYTYNDWIFRFELFDISENAVIGCFTLDAHELIPDEEDARKKLGVDSDYDMSYDLEPFVSNDTFFLDDDTLVISFQNLVGYKMYVTWDISMQVGFESKIVTSECDDIESCYDESSISQLYPILQPSVVSEEYLPLREKADKIAEKYGIEILIENEAIGFMGNYVLKGRDSNPYATDPYSSLSSALDSLDRELARYPEGFLEQISNDGCNGFRFILTGDIEGIETDDAGGFKYAIDGIINVVISSLTPDLSSVLHHELSHAIDHYVEEKLEGTFEFSEGWNKLNPEDDIWYIDGEATTEEIYDECYINDLDPSGAYYISYYGHTNATEDRATIFSEVMTPDDYLQTDFHKIPFIKAKLNYYADCIRLAFDGSENWGELPWEKYLDS